MIPFPIQIPPDEAMRELVAANQKAIRGLETLSHIREEDIPTGVSAKEAVFEEDKLTLYHYTRPARESFSGAKLAEAGPGRIPD